jgi:hypothetical protein
MAASRLGGSHRSARVPDFGATSTSARSSGKDRKQPGHTIRGRSRPSTALDREPTAQIGCDEISLLQKRLLPAVGALAGVEFAAGSPGRIIIDPIGWVGDHQVRLGPSQNWRDFRGAGAVAAANSVVSQQPYIAEPSDRLIGHLCNAVGIRQTARSQNTQDGFELIRLEADQAEIETGEIELAELVA